MENFAKRVDLHGLSVTLEDSFRIFIIAPRFRTFAEVTRQFVLRESKVKVGGGETDGIGPARSPTPPAFNYARFMRGTSEMGTSA